MHAHVSALLAVPAFLAVLLAGTLWRLIAGRAVASGSPLLESLGGAMALQY